MTQADMPEPATIRVMFGGDLMLGRGVGRYILRDGAGYPLQPVAGLMRAADMTVVNLECAITASSDPWPGAPKAYYFGAPPQAIDTLTSAGIDLVSMANNHVLDFGIAGMRDTLRLLDRHGIRHAGAGQDLAQALSPAIVDCGGSRFGMAAFCDHQADFAARVDCAGMSHIDLDDEDAATATWRKALQALRRAQVDWPILAMHWGPNMVLRPSAKFRRLAHAAIDMGWKILFGHSAHVFQGIEIYRGYPIIYAAGDLVDDYYVDPDFRNDHQLLYGVELGATALRRITLHPLFIEHCQVRPAAGEQHEHVVSSVASLCGELGTRVWRDGTQAWIDGPAAT